MEEKYLDAFLKNTRDYYLADNEQLQVEKVKDLLKKDFKVFHIQKIAFEEEVSRKDAFENVISAMRIDGVNFLYLILGNEVGVEFYFGVVKDLHDKEAKTTLDIDEIGKDILKPSILGNFKGSAVDDSANQLKSIKSAMEAMGHYGVLEGVPGIIEDNQQKEQTVQGVDRLIDVMLGDSFAVSILASPMSFEEIEKIEDILYEIHDDLAPLAKMTVQQSDSKGGSEGSSESTSDSKATGGSSSTATQKKGVVTETSSTAFAEPKSRGSKEETVTKSNGKNKTITDAKTETQGESETITEGATKGSNKSENWNKGTTESIEYGNKRFADWASYLDEIVFKRLDYGKSKGLFKTNIFLAASNRMTLVKLGNTMQALFSGTNGNKVPLLMKEIENQDIIGHFLNFQHPYVKLDIEDRREKDIRVVLSQNVSRKKKGFYFGNWMSTNELSLIAGLPQKEVVGLLLKEEVEFGLNANFNKIEKENRLHLGNLVRSGEELKIPIYIDKQNLDKHTFITGVTGSGKTTTCLKILLGSELPFLVIEPAKTEYRVLKNKFDDLLIFTLGDESVAPFRLNPFEFFPHENITARVDMIKASIEAAFDMDAAIPQLIEAALYRCYEDYGWNVATNKNSKFAEPFKPGVSSFPTLSDLIINVEKVSKEQGFGERLQMDYIGSIKARLQGLMVGAKGQMLNTRRSIDFRDLVDKRVVLELEEIRNGNEKSLIMGFVLSNLNEAIKALHYEAIEAGRKFRHITLVEEAHRLLTKFEPGDNPNKKQGIETFTDMLAEVRKYGESLIIVDQIPNKLTSEVLKNTNTKIIHKLFARDDKDAIGDTIALDDEQKDFLSNLSVGRVIMNSQDFEKPMQVQIEEDKTLSTTLSKPISKVALRDSVLEYYGENFELGIIHGLQYLEEKPDVKTVEQILEINLEGNVEGMIHDALYKKEIQEEFRSAIRATGWNKIFLSRFILNTYFKENQIYDEMMPFLHKFIDSIFDNTIKMEQRDFMGLGIN